ncbi:MAG: class I SAM-dependent methyltransferase [Gammaproteobacteria bacterium]|nr:class I SAM-dependent methyltransferase [Gammaproteobacteria bacterium]MDX2488298.1 class I SAM-dependent methyltransferase [Gammaproteobacteria bacterium]
MVELEVFKNFSLEYDKWFENHEVEYALELKAIREYLPKEGDGLEIGAGTGRFTQPLGISLGVEPSEAMRSLALSRGANTVAGTAESLPVVDATYEYAVLVTTVCFLDEPELAFKEVYRVLKAEGLIIVGLIDKDSKLGKKYEEKKNISKFYKNANFHSVVEIQKKLENAGFSNIECIQALLPGDKNENYKPEVKQGYGEGSFVVLRGQKNDV